MANIKYRDKMLPKIKEWAAAGLANYQIAHNLSVSNATFSFWVKTKPELVVLLEKARQPRLLEVVNNLYKVANGYETVEMHVEKCGARKVIKKIRREVPPNVKAISMILTNRMPEEWTASAKIGIDVKGLIQAGEIDVSKLTDEQLDAIGAALRTDDDHE